MPVIYYGEEIGMEDVWMPKKQAKDPISNLMKPVPQFIRKKLPVPLNRDVCRTPMQWDATTNAGFSSASPWLPVGADYKIRNVQTQAGDSLSLLNTYKNLLRIRKSTDVFASGSITLETDLNTKNILAYTLNSPAAGAYTVLLNFSDKTQTVTLPLGNYTLIYALNNVDRLNTNTVTLAPNSGVIVRVK